MSFQWDDRKAMVNIVHRQGGGNYQSLINDALRQHIGAQQYAWEETVRRIVREELGRYDAGRRGDEAS